jgi:hypothetical protein
MAGGHGSLAVDFDQAHTARAIGFEPFGIAQRGDVRAARASGLEQRRTVGNPDGLPVDGHRDGLSAHTGTSASGM